MQPDITVSIGLDVAEKGVELAELVFDIAQECDTTRAYRRTINLNSFVDKIALRLEIFKVQQENAHLPQEEVQKLIDTITAEYERKNAQLAAEQAAKREKVKRYINENAAEGYSLAYRLCKEDNSDKAKELAYRMIHCLKNFSVEQRLEICRQYAESLVNLGKSGTEIAKVYCQMASMVYPVSKRMDHMLCLSYYEKAYGYIDEPTRLLDEIIGFCNLYGIDELRVKCENKKAALQSDL